mgnify:CR=1 FL=1
MQTFAFDIGSNFDTGIYGFVLGMAVTNLGPEVKFEGEGLEIDIDDDIFSKITEEFPLPMTFRLGLMNQIIGPNSDIIKNNNQFNYYKSHPKGWLFYSAIFVIIKSATLLEAPFTPNFIFKAL